MLLPINKNGFVVNKGNKDKIQPKFRKLVRDTKQACVKFFGKSIYSFYVRGSISVGKAISGFSDIDCVLVLNREVTKNDRKWLIDLTKTLEQKHPEITGVDLTALSLDKLLYSREYKNLRVFVKTQSALLCGSNVLKYLPSVKPGRELALYMYGDVIEELRKLLTIFKTGKVGTYLDRKRPIKFWCVWTCRTILRSSLSFSMVEKPVYTSDLIECKKIFEEKYPEFKHEMEKVLYWAANPTNDRKAFSMFLIDFIPKYAKLWMKFRE